MAQININDFHQAWRNWRDVGLGHYVAFVTFLEAGAYPISWDKAGQVHRIHPDSARRIEMLCGPHHRAIIKAYYANKHPIT